jgi:hypothetical protein
MEMVRAAAATYSPIVPLKAFCRRLENVRLPEGRALYARYAKPDEEMSAAVGKMWEPREKSQRVMGRARDAGWDFMMGTSNRERVAMPPEAMKAVDMLKI